jgi:hypothetical protein
MPFFDEFLLTRQICDIGRGHYEKASGRKDRSVKRKIIQAYRIVWHPKSGSAKM